MLNKLGEHRNSTLYIDGAGQLRVRTTEYSQSDEKYFYDCHIPWELIDKAIQWREQQRLENLKNRPDVKECPICLEYIRAADIHRHIEAHSNG